MEKKPMRCTNCPSNDEMKSTRITHKYDVSGLDNVILRGVSFCRCKHCGESYYDYGDIDQLNNVIARVLIKKKGILNGQEIKFLRKRLGLSGAEFARRVQIASETLSRYENDQTKASAVFDMMIRALAATRLPDRDYDLHDELLNDDKKCIVKTIELKAHPKTGGWTVAA
jgi:putative zinc finger/helix-turn-helix YgiT family protein